MTHDDFLHRIGCYAASLKRGADCDGAKLRRRKGREAPEIPPNRSARGTDDDRLASEVAHV